MAFTGVVEAKAWGSERSHDHVTMSVDDEVIDKTYIEEITFATKDRRTDG